VRIDLISKLERENFLVIAQQDGRLSGGTSDSPSVRHLASGSSCIPGGLHRGHIDAIRSVHDVT
jgi:hypothetical protein